VDCRVSARESFAIFPSPFVFPVVAGLIHQAQTFAAAFRYGRRPHLLCDGTV